jgi:hypothetical protein
MKSYRRTWHLDWSHRGVLVDMTGVVDEVLRDLITVVEDVSVGWGGLCGAVLQQSGRDLNEFVGMLSRSRRRSWSRRWSC